MTFVQSAPGHLVNHMVRAIKNDLAAISKCHRQETSFTAYAPPKNWLQLENVIITCREITRTWQCFHTNSVVNAYSHEWKQAFATSKAERWKGGRLLPDIVTQANVRNGRRELSQLPLGAAASLRNQPLELRDGECLFRAQLSHSPVFCELGVGIRLLQSGIPFGYRP